MDDEGEWVPLVTPRADEDGDEELLLQLRGARAQMSSENGLAAAASHSAEDIGEGFPLRRLFGSLTKVPDFTRIPPDRWEEAMRTVPQHLRLRSVQGMAVEDPVRLVKLALSDLPPTPSDRARAAVLARPELAPVTRRRSGREANRQVNFRLTEQEYVDLATAAQIIGTTPTGLAAQLVRNGVRRVIEEANRRDS